MPIGKRLRFEVFARDGFTCQYCGKRPPDVLLEVDHIHPQSKGGTDDNVNLITACMDCNRGKSALVISTVAPRPDANLELLAIQQETAEVERYLRAKEMRDEARERLDSAMCDIWTENLTEEIPRSAVFRGWIERYGPEEVEHAIKTAGVAYSRGQFYGSTRSVFNALLKYVSGILRNRFDGLR